MKARFRWLGLAAGCWLGALVVQAQPSATTTSAFDVNGATASLGGSFQPNGVSTAVWFEYGLTNTYGSDTRSRSSDDAEGYTTWAYGNNGGSGLGPVTYREGVGGGIYLETSGGQIDGAKSFAIFSGNGAGNTQACDRALRNPQPVGRLTLSVRFNVNNATSFSGFNLKSAQGATFGASELISIGIRPGNGNNRLAVNGGAQTIDLGADIRGQVVDLVLDYDCTAGTYVLGAKFRAGATFLTTSGPLRLTGQTAAYLGFGNFNTGNLQNVIYDSIQLVSALSAGSGPGAVERSAGVSGLTPNTTYHYRAVAQNAQGTATGEDRTFGGPLVPAPGAATMTFAAAGGAFQARVFPATGHVALALPDLNGQPLATVVTLAPARARLGGVLYDFGEVLGHTPIAGGLELTQRLAGTSVTTQLRFAADGTLTYEVTNWNGLAPTETRLVAASDSSEHFFGLGEKFNAFDQTGNRVRMLTFDQPGTKGDAAYKPVPWFLSTRGYGLHLDSTAESFFDLRNGAPDRLVVENLLGALKCHLVPGPRLTEALARFTARTGRPQLPPPWVFGTWISSDIWRTGGEVRYAVEKHRQSGIPASVFVFDSPWEVAYNDFTWNLSQFAAGGTYEGSFYPGFASLAEMMTFFQQRGLKVICWMTPFLNVSSNNEGIPGQNTGQAANYAEAAANNYFVRASPGGPPLVVPWWKGSGSPVDFTNAAARSWLGAQLSALLAQSSVPTANASLEPVIGGFKTDDGETSNGSNTYIPTTAVYADGRTGLEMRNGYCVEYHRTVAAVAGPNGILFARGGFTGTQACPVGWAGDNEPNFGAGNGLQSVIVAGQSAAMSGFALWSHDIGGYQNSNFEANPADLFMRWTQFGALTPVMQMHRQVNAGDLRQYPWGYGAAALANYVAWAEFHTRLFPYLYTYAQEAGTGGLPIIRPLVLLHQDDANTYPLRHTYFFGNELLVAPMNAANSISRNVYLPAGTWIDFWTQAEYPGGQTIAWSNADPTRMPLFVRQGAIIPLLQNAPQTLCDANYVHNPALSTPDSGLEFLVYPQAAGSFTLYDGTTVAGRTDGSVTTLDFSSGPRALRWKVRAAAAPAGVERNGVRLPQRATPAEFDAATLGWRHDGTFVWVKFPHGGGPGSLAFGPAVSPRGVTESWRQFHGITDDLADPDGDGLSNADEYLAGTNPHDPASAFTASATGVGGPFLLRWPSVDGLPYQVQWKSALTDASWTTVPLSFSGTGGLLSWTDDGSQTAPLPASRRFYRLAVP